MKEPFSPVHSVVSTEPFRGCYVRAQPFSEFPPSTRRYLPPQVRTPHYTFSIDHRRRCSSHVEALALPMNSWKSDFNFF
jgi:hypothetical protein